MEAVTQSVPLQFKYGDLVVFVKPVASSEDRMEYILTDSRAARCRTAVARMVTGWKGLKIGDEEVPYSLEALSTVPDIPGEGVFFLKLGNWIIDNTDLLKGIGRKLKNDSAPSSTGACEQEPSTAGAKTA